MRSIDVRTYDLAVSGHDHTDIPGSYSAKMSIPYATAAGFLFGKAGLAEFSEETVADPAVLELTSKIRVSADEALSEAFPGIQAAVVTVAAKNGTFTERVDYPKGEPENPLTDAEFRERYDDLMAYGGIGAEKSTAVFDAVSQETRDVSGMLKNL